MARFDYEGEVLNLVGKKRHDTLAAPKLLKRLLRTRALEPKSIVTNGPTSYGSADRVVSLRGVHRPSRLCQNYRAENSHLPTQRREQRMLGCKSRFPATHDQPAGASDLPRTGGFRLGERGSLNGMLRSPYDSPSGSFLTEPFLEQLLNVGYSLRATSGRLWGTS